MDTDTPRAPALDELDLAIVHALQIQPRVPWVRVGQVLEVAAVPVAPRWERLAGARAAWAHGSP